MEGKAGKVGRGFEYLDVAGVPGWPFVAVEECNWGNGLGDEERMSGLELDPWWLISSLREWENERELFDEYARLGSVLEDQDKLALLDVAENKALRYLDDLLRWRPSNGSVNHPSSGTVGSGSAVHCRGLCSSLSAATRSGWNFDQLPLRVIWFPARGVTDTRIQLVYMVPQWRSHQVIQVP